VDDGWSSSKQTNEVETDGVGGVADETDEKRSVDGDTEERSVDGDTEASECGADAREVDESGADARSEENKIR
jgi:hypothetical protein